MAYTLLLGSRIVASLLLSSIVVPAFRCQQIGEVLLGSGQLVYGSCGGTVLSLHQTVVRHDPDEEHGKDGHEERHESHDGATVAQVACLFVYAYVLVL